MKPQVFRHWDEEEANFIGVASCSDSPVEGVTAVGTLGLSDHHLGMGTVRVELIGAFPSTCSFAPNIAATCAFNAFKDGISTRPDAIHPRVVEVYDPDAKLPHILMVDPFLWDDGPKTLASDNLQIAWLMMVPITEGERQFASERSVAALTDLFEREQIDIFDLARRSVV